MPTASASATAKGRVAISGVAVLTNGRVLDPSESKYTHMFDADLFNPGTDSGALAALRYFDRNGPMSTPYAYFIIAQITSMPSILPPKSAGEDATARNVITEGIPLSEYHLIGDIKQVFPYGPVTEDMAEEGGSLVDPRVPPYIFASGPVETVEVASDHITFTVSVNQYVNATKGYAAIDVRCKIDIPAEGTSGRWSFLAKPEKRRNFIQRSGFVYVEGKLANVSRDPSSQATILDIAVEEVALLGKAPVPTLDFGDDQSPLKGKGKRPMDDPVTPKRFVYSRLPASGLSVGKRRKVESQSSTEITQSSSPAPAVPSSSQSNVTPSQTTAPTART